jgi:hypothetical protein
VPVAPAAGTDVIELVKATEHFTPVGELTEMDDDPQAGARHASAIDQSSLAASDVRAVGWRPGCGRALMRVAHQCKRFAQLYC